MFEQFGKVLATLFASDAWAVAFGSFAVVAAIFLMVVFAAVVKGTPIALDFHFGRIEIQGDNDEPERRPPRKPPKKMRAKRKRANQNKSW